MKISADALPYILYQRTGYAREGIGALIAKVERRVPALYKSCVWLRAQVCAAQVRSGFEADIRNDFAQIESYLPKKPAVSVLDIGCGIGGIHPLINTAYKGQVFFTMYDKTQVEDRIWYDFTKAGAFYNDLSKTKAFLVDNGIDSAQIETQEATEHPTFSRKYDLITSFISWGWHYPLSTYWTEMMTALADDGVLIVDVRKDQGGKEFIETQFTHVKSIDTNKRGERIVAWGKRAA